MYAVTFWNIFNKTNEEMLGLAGKALLFLEGGGCISENTFKETVLSFFVRMFDDSGCTSCVLQLALCWINHCGCFCFQWVEYRKLDNAHGVRWSCVLCGMAASILGPADQRGRAQDGCGKRLFYHHHKVGCSVHATTESLLFVKTSFLSVSSL